MMGFPEIWEEIGGEDIEPRDRWQETDWGRGKEGYLSLVVRVDGRVPERLGKVQEELGEFSCLEMFPDPYLHITVAEIGIRNSDDVVDGVSEALEGTRPFTVEFGGLNMFPSVVFVKADSDILRELHGAVTHSLGLSVEREYLPHVTLAQFVSTEGVREAIDYIRKKREEDLGEINASSVELVEDDITGEEPGFRTVEEFRF